MLYQLVTLRRQLRARVFGARLSLRMLSFLAVMAVVPGVLVYTVSVQFLTKSIESWFDVRVEAALESGLGLGRTALDSLMNDLRAKGRGMALELSDLPANQQVGTLNRMREQAGVDEVVLLSPNGQVLGIASRQVRALLPDTPPAAVLRQARTSRDYAATEPDGDRGLRMRVIVPLVGAGLGEDTRFLQLVQPVPSSLTESAETVQDVYRDYRELSLLRTGLRRIYLVTLTLTLLLALFSAVALAFVLSRRLAEPLAQLAEATAAVARGDFTARARVTSRDELGVLTRSFNSMTSQLDEARAAADASRAETESAKAYLENILVEPVRGRAHVRHRVPPQHRQRRRGRDPAARRRRLRGTRTRRDAANSTPSPRRSVRALPTSWATGRRRSNCRRATRCCCCAARRCRRRRAAATSWCSTTSPSWSPRSAPPPGARWRGASRTRSRIRSRRSSSRPSACRPSSQAKLGPDDAQTLDARHADHRQPGVGDEAHGRRFQRLRAHCRCPILPPLDLNQLITEVLSLYEESRAVIVVRLGEDVPPALGDATQLRQVIHNLLQNAEDALVRPRGSAHRSAHRVRSAAACASRCIDNGGGFPEGVMKRVFEPYVTTKPKGTGLGLAIVKKIIDEHHGTVNIENRARTGDRGGAAVTIALPLAA